MRGLKDKVSRLVAGERISVNTVKFQNDMTTFDTADDVLTLLIHLGYLTYDFYEKKCYIPNSEIAQEFINCIEDGGYEEVMKAILSSKELLKATLNKEEKEVSRIIEKIHDENISIFKYNDENSLSCVILLAYYAAKDDYVMYREIKAGKGVADIVFIPRSTITTPALVIELKCNRNVDAAIEQIKNKQYVECLKDYSGKILLIGINYDTKKKKHTAKIEEIEK